MAGERPRLKQCKTCPWRQDADPYAIPNGYCPTKHAALHRTIAEPGRLAPAGGGLRMMACHQSPVGSEYPCAGWLENQLGPGNNIALRLAYYCDNTLPIPEVDGPQHERFEDTLPDGGDSREDEDG